MTKYNRIETVRLMIELYCHGKHDSNDMCGDCKVLFEYAKDRCDHCPRGPNAICSDCPHPCYIPEMRTRIKEVMRYSGPRMILHHPIFAIRHIINKVKTERK